MGSPGMNFIDCRLERQGQQFELVSEGLRLAAPASKRTALETQGQADVVVGIRPEHITVRSHSEGGAHSLSGVIADVEPLGSHTYLNLMLGPQRLIAEVPPSSAFRPHDRIAIHFDAERMHVFRRGSHGSAID
jgi:multiple sugar transport system ATP-binding protein